MSLDEVCGAAWGVGGGEYVWVGGGEYVWVGVVSVDAVKLLSVCRTVAIMIIIAATNATEKITPNLSTPAIFLIFTGILNI